MVSMIYFLVGRKPKTQQSPISNGSPELGIKKKPREGKGNLGRAILEVKFCFSVTCRKIISSICTCEMTVFCGTLNQGCISTM